MSHPARALARLAVTQPAAALGSLRGHFKQFATGQDPSLNSGQGFTRPPSAEELNTPSKGLEQEMAQRSGDPAGKEEPGWFDQLKQGVGQMKDRLTGAKDAVAGAVNNTLIEGEEAFDRGTHAAADKTRAVKDRVVSGVEDALHSAQHTGNAARERAEAVAQDMSNKAKEVVTEAKAAAGLPSREDGRPAGGGTSEPVDDILSGPTFLKDERQQVDASQKGTNSG